MLPRSLQPLLLACGIFAAAASAESVPPSWTDTPLARLEALALIETLNADILSSNSATLTLERWCREHALAEPAQIRAHRIDAQAQAPSESVRQDLDIGPQEPVRYRRVELSCGGHLLSVADNWYVPSRLTGAMNQLLDGSETPFGKVVQALRPHRETLNAQLLWAPLPAGWERPGADLNAGQASLAQSLMMPPALFEHRAVLFTPEHRAIAEVHEVYQRGLLDFPEPRLPQSR